MNPRPRANRRKFLKTAAAASAVISLPAFIPGRTLGKDGAVAPSNRHTLGVIGIGPRCTHVLTRILDFKDVQCVAIADVQKSRRDAGKKLVDSKYGNDDLKLYRDLREILDRKDIDSVLIATGDRWHAPAAIMAAKAGKDIYCEKPCGITIGSARNYPVSFRRRAESFRPARTAAALTTTSRR
jgi:hypothetical protein